MSDQWRNELATEKQKEKLRFFGCTWDDGITAGQAQDALADCAIQFPEAEATWQKTQPAREDQKEKLRYFGCTWNGDINVGQAIDALLQCAIDFPDKEAVWQFHKPIAEIRSFADKSWHVGEEFLPTPEQLAEIRAFGKKPPKGLTYSEAQKLIAQCKKIHNFKPPEHHDDSPKEAAAGVTPPKTRSEGFFCGTPGSPTAASDQLPEQKSSPSKWSNLFEERKRAEEVTIQEASKPQTSNPSEYTIPAREVQNYAESSAGPSGKVGKVLTKEPKRPKYISYPREPRRQSFNSGLDFDYDYEKAKTNWIAEVKTIEAENRRRHEMYCAAIKSWYVQHNWNTDWEPHSFPKSPLSQSAGQQEVTIQEVVHPRIQKPTAYSYHAPIERFAEWVDGFTERNVTCPGGHWLPAGPLSYVFASDAITIDLCRQMAETIEARGYCVEPDARFGSGTYDRNQTLALFKPLDGDPIQPSTAYLGAANLLRLCVLITTADGKIDLVELDLFRQAIENQAGLTLTDHKR